MGLMGVFQKEQDEKCPLANNQRLVQFAGETLATLCSNDFII